ncbi:MAG: hypothetical protein IKR11_10895, partial [Solobacterium sp.]|nr:hypothetical protein [Solobacterium sp.]
NTKNYLSHNERFAELINRSLYGGTAFVDPCRLEDITVQPLGSAAIRDLLKKCTVKKDRGTTYVIYGIENMQYPIYDAPVKAMWYDANDYRRQLQEIKRTNEGMIKNGRLKGESSGEFNERFLKTDRLDPVITVGIYWGSGEWDGPLTLREMMSTDDERVLGNVPDYKPHILIPSRMTDEEINAYGEGLDLAFALAKASGNKEEMRKLAKDKRFEKVDRETYSFLNTQYSLKMKEKEDEEGDVNMCKGMEDWLNDEIMEATRRNTIEVTKQVTEQVTRETKMSALQANIHAMTMEGLGDEIIRRICMNVFPDMADCIEEQILKERQLFS